MVSYSVYNHILLWKWSKMWSELEYRTLISQQYFRINLKAKKWFLNNWRGLYWRVYGMYIITNRFYQTGKETCKTAAKESLEGVVQNNWIWKLIFWIFIYQGHRYDLSKSWEMEIIYLGGFKIDIKSSSIYRKF